MHSVKQKVLALLLVTALACTFMLPAFAAGGEPAPQEPQYIYEAITDKTAMANSAKASSEETSDEAAGWNDGRAAWAFDGNTGKCWHSSYTAGDPANCNFSIEWDLTADKASVLVGQLEYQTKTPKQDNGKWKVIEIFATVEGKEVSVFQGDIHRDDAGHALITFPGGPVNATHLKVVITETDGDQNGGNNNNKFAAAGELTVYKATLVEPEPQPEPEKPAEHAALDKTAMAKSAQASSEEPAEGGNPSGDGPAAWAFDNNVAKPWHSKYTNGEVKGTHWIKWNLGETGETFEVSKVHYDMKNNLNSGNGLWQKVTVEAFLADQQVFTKEFTVDNGNFDLVLGENVVADSMKITVTQSINQMSCAGEITVYGVKKDVVPQPPQPDNSVAVVVAADGTETKFDTVADAVAAAEADETVRLTKDSTAEAKIVLDKKLTLDLNGFTLTAATGELLHVMPTGDVQIVDNASKDANGALIGVAGAELGDPAALTIANQGKLTLNGVDVIGAKADSVALCASVNAIFVDAGAELVVTGDSAVVGVRAAQDVTDLSANVIINYGTVTLNGTAIVAGAQAASVTTEAMDGFNLGMDVIATDGVLNVAENASVVGAVAQSTTGADIRAVAATGTLNLAGGTIRTESETAAVVLTGTALTMAEGANGVVPVIENTCGAAVAFAEDYENTQNITAGILTNPAVSGQITDLNQAVADGFTTETGNRAEAGWVPAADGAYTKVIKGEKPQPAPFEWKFSNLSVAGNVAVNFYGIFNQDLTDNATVVISAPNQPEVKVAVNAAPNTEHGRKFTACVSVRQMTDTIQVKVMKGEQQIGETFEYTVQTNAKKLIAESSKEAADFARAMLYHGAEMQKLKGYNTDKLATEGVDVTALDQQAKAITAQALEARNLKPVITGNDLPGLNLYGVNLSLEDETTLRYFFNKTADFDAKNFTVTAVQKTFQFKENGKFVCIEIEDIPASHLGTMIRLTVAGASNQLTVDYSPLSYAYNVIKGVEAGEANAAEGVARSLVVYGDAADVYAASVTK